MAADAITVPTVPFEVIQGRMARLWDPFERNPQVAVYGFTGAGKSYLIRYGILPLRKFSRIVLFDVKGDTGDNPWTGWGTPADELAPEFTGHVRLIVRRADMKRQIRAALDLIREEGHCVVVIDDMRSVTEREQAGQASMVDNLATEGRGMGITMVMGTQSTAYAVPSMKDQPAAFFIGQMRNLDQAKNLADITGHGRALIPAINHVPSRSFIYGDAWGSSPILAQTTAK